MHGLKYFKMFGCKLCLKIFFVSILPYLTSCKLTIRPCSQLKRIVATSLLSCWIVPLCGGENLVHARMEDADSIRFVNGLKELENLDTNWDKIVKGEGDNIRRKLGTVYKPPACESPLCGFSNFVPRYVKTHEDINLAEFDGPSGELLEALNQADFLAYSSIFSEYGNGGGGKDYIDDSRGQVKKAIVAMKKVIEVIEEE